MADNIKNMENNSSVDTGKFSESKGTGIFSSLVFMIIVIVLMIVIAKVIN